MKEPVRQVGIVGDFPGTAGRNPKTGLISLIGAAARRLAGREPHDTVPERVAQAEEGRGRDPGVARSSLDAGLTGGMSLLIGTRSGQKRRR